MDNYRKYFAHFVKENYPNIHVKILPEIEKHFTIISRDIAFAKTSKNPIDKRLDFCAYFLALIKTLDERGETFENIRKICLQITTEYVKPKNRFQSYFKRFIPKLIPTLLGQILVKSFHKRVSVNKSPEGFIANIITNKHQTFGLGYGVDIIECGICKLFNKHHYSKYASILCEVDEITSGLAGLQLIRSGTIANGAKKCDFRFKMVEQ